jgi:nicotinate-nucleotide pyrophosphorylase (carboxylating)
MQIEIETRSMEDVHEAMECFDSGYAFQRLMVDSFALDQMQEAVGYINHRVEIEASGNVTLQTVRAVAETGVDLISVGALTHSVKALDISMNLKLHL